MKTKTELEQLNTKRLLSYYRSQRQKYQQFVTKHTCPTCGVPYCFLCGEEMDRENEEKGGLMYEELQTAKSILDNRENV